MSGFNNLYRHGMARMAVFAPVVAPANPAANADAILENVREAEAQNAALALFPELTLSGYAIDDLHHQASVLDAVEGAAARVIEASRDLAPVIAIGAAVRLHDQLFNCALIIHRGALLGVVPKSFLPNYREFYEKRWFADASSLTADRIRFAGQDAPLGVDLVFEADDLPGFCFHVEICEDLWSPTPPSVQGALAGARILLNMSASNATIGKSRDRAVLCEAQSRRLQAAYVFSAAGTGESTTDIAWDGQLTVFELGEPLGASERFTLNGSSLFADIDIERIGQDRLRSSTFRDAVARRSQPFRRVSFQAAPPLDRDIPLQREIARFPFVPDEIERLDEDCFEAYTIQVTGLSKRLRATGIRKAVIGVSGGLDSTQALIVTARAFDRLGLDRSGIRAVTLPGFATSETTRANAIALIEGLGATHQEIDIRPAAGQMLDDIDHPYSDGVSDFDVTFENVQAGLRTDYLFRLANHHDGLVIGTGDLSELALGWCTYGVGDHMSHYNVNAGVAKTLIQHLIHWCADREEYGADVSAVLLRILDTEISPELVPAGADGAIQSTQDIIGPYPLQDFNLHYAARYGLGPAKIAFLAHRAWGEAEHGRWPAHTDADDRRAYALEEIVDWLDVFAHRFYQTSQFKRSAMPNGPKVTSAAALSPRGDWRAPSDVSARVWRDEIAALKTELGF
ncbi:MAG: NAD(+) synthase [Pseudomonadota bacterium]